MLKRSLKEILVSEYSFNKASLKWIPAGGSILEYIGQQVVYVDYTRENEESPWEISQTVAYIQDIHDFEPLSGTYEILFTVGEDPEIKRERIIPEGFSYNSPDLHNWMHRFIPYSVHFELAETEMKYSRYKDLFQTKPGLDMSGIKSLVASEDLQNRLGFFENWQALIDTDIEGGLGVGILAFRIAEISEPKLLSKTWRFGIRDKDNNFYPIRIEKSAETETVIKGWTLGDEVIGDLKIIRL